MLVAILSVSAFALIAVFFAALWIDHGEGARLGRTRDAHRPSMTERAED